MKFNMKSARLFSLAIWSSIVLLPPLYGDQVLKLSLIAEPETQVPCISSLMGPPGKYCIKWNNNVEAQTTWEKSRRLIFLGAGDEYLHVVDEKGRPIYQLSTEGRVVTASLFNEDRTVFYIGTDKGIVYGIDSFSFEPIFSFRADSKVNDNFVLISGNLVFTSALGTAYCLDAKDGELKWHIEQPLSVDRLRLMPLSNILPYNGGGGGEQAIIPHAEGYISVIDIKTGSISKKISLGASRPGKFLDIVAPMVLLKNHLWVASYDLGIFAIDIATGKFRYSIDEKGVVQLAKNGDKIFAASADSLYSILASGDIIWKQRLDEFKTRIPRAAFPFNKLKLGARRVFYGTPSVLLSADKLILATSAGSLGVFDQASGRLDEILGNSVGFGKIGWAGDDVVVMTRSGLFMIFRSKLLLSIHKT